MKKCCNRLRLRAGVGVDENLPTPTQTPTPVKTTDSGRLRLRLRLRSPEFARVEFAHCRSAARGHLRSMTSVDLTFTSNHRICDYNRFLRWWIRIEMFYREEKNVY